jgi:hypothetical protein
VDLDRYRGNDLQDFYHGVCRLCCLGELYDKWRHALERKKDLDVGGQVWESYEALLKFLVAAEVLTMPENRRRLQGVSRGLQSVVWRVGHPFAEIPNQMGRAHENSGLSKYTIAR